MALIVIALVVLGFFFPPVWAVLAVMGLYIWASRKSRRTDAIESRVARMVRGGVEYAHFDDLYFEAARKYAIDKGSETTDEQSASAIVVIDHEPFNVVFSRGIGGGTGMIVRNLDTVHQDILERLFKE